VTFSAKGLVEYMGTVSARYLRSFYTSCLAHGCPAEALDAVIPGAPDILNNPAKRFDRTLLLDMLHAAQAATGNEAIGLLAGQAFRPSTFLDIGYGLIACANLQEALAFNARYQRLTQEIGRTSLRIENDTANIHWETDIDNVAYLRPFTEAVFAGYAVLGRWLTWTYDQKILGMHFRHAAPESLDPYTALFDCPLYFGCEKDTMELETSLVEQPLPQPNRQLLDHLSDRLDRALEALDQPMGSAIDVRLCIQQLFSDMPERSAAPTINEVASALGQSERSLRRHLAQEGTSFRAELAAARKEACEIYLKEDKWSAAQIAQMLGYSEQSAFSRAFKSWFGVAPSHYLRTMA
jgi:AraC-like DNA-binding protein